MSMEAVETTAPSRDTIPCEELSSEGALRVVREGAAPLWPERVVAACSAQRAPEGASSFGVRWRVLEHVLGQRNARSTC